MKDRFSLGIDLGTSNCAMALTDLETDRTEVLPITQILAANQMGEKLTLASGLYLAASGGIPTGVIPAAMERQRGPGDRWPVRPRSWRARARPPCSLRQILAVQPAHRSAAVHTALAV